MREPAAQPELTGPRCDEAEDLCPGRQCFWRRRWVGFGLRWPAEQAHTFTTGIKANARQRSQASAGLPLVSAIASAYTSLLSSRSANAKPKRASWRGCPHSSRGTPLGSARWRQGRGARVRAQRGSHGLRARETKRPVPSLILPFWLLVLLRPAYARKDGLSSLSGMCAIFGRARGRRSH